MSACINSSCLSLLDSCIPMRFLVAAVTCCVLSDGTVILDPQLKQMKNSSATLVFVFESRTLSAISTHTEGLVNQEKLQQCYIVAKTAVEKIFKFYRIVIAKKFSKELA